MQVVGASRTSWKWVKFHGPHSKVWPPSPTKEKVGTELASLKVKFVRHNHDMILWFHKIGKPLLQSICRRSPSPSSDERHCTTGIYSVRCIKISFSSQFVIIFLETMVLVHWVTSQTFSYSMNSELNAWVHYRYHSKHRWAHQINLLISQRISLRFVLIISCLSSARAVYS